MAAKEKDNDTRTNAQSPGLESRRELLRKLGQPLEPDYKCGFDGWPSDEINCPKCLSDSPFHELDETLAQRSESKIANLKSYQIEQAIELLITARNLLRKAGADKSRAYVARSIKSAQGALSNRRRFEFKAAQNKH